MTFADLIKGASLTHATALNLAVTKPLDDAFGQTVPLMMGAIVTASLENRPTPLGTAQAFILNGTADHCIQLACRRGLLTKNPDGSLHATVKLVKLWAAFNRPPNEATTKVLAILAEHPAPRAQAAA
jgi:hypothetical protein